jgi:hypothetical protein
MLYMRLRLPELEFNSCEPLSPLEFLALGVTWECPPVPLQAWNGHVNFRNIRFQKEELCRRSCRLCTLLALEKCEV